MLNIKTLMITPEMLSLIAALDEFKGAWQFMDKIKPDRLSQLKKIATIESIGSSTRIEGAKLSDRQVETLLLQSDSSFENRDQQEVAGYAFACEKILDHFSEINFTENYIKQLHMWLLQYSNKDDRHRGEYKKIPIRIEAFDIEGTSKGILFETTSPLETPHQMQDLVLWTDEALRNKSLHPLLVIGIFVVLFLAIHPFQDGNGRLSRLLTTLLMLKSGYSYVPYSSLESIIEANKENYYIALNKTQKSWQNHHPDWAPWLLFFLNCLLRQKEHLTVKLEKEKILMKQIPNLSKQILDLLHSHGSLSIKEIEVLTVANRNTLKKALAALVKDKLILLDGKGKLSRYSRC